MSNDNTDTCPLLDYCQIFEELAGLDISIGNNQDARSAALIDAINYMTQEPISVLDDTIKIDSKLMEIAFSSFKTTAAFKKFIRSQRLKNRQP